VSAADHEGIDELAIMTAPSGCRFEAAPQRPAAELFSTAGDHAPSPNGDEWTAPPSR